MENCPEDWERFAKEHAENCIETEEDIDFANEVYESTMIAGESLWNMYNEDLNHEHGFLLWDIDYQFLVKNGLMEGLLILASPMLGYGSAVWGRCFKKSNYSVVERRTCRNE